MASTCISHCLMDAQAPVRRATYVNLYKWPESDMAFVRSLSANNRGGTPSHNSPDPAVVDIISCRQLYLRSYTFSQKNKKRSSSSRPRRINEKRIAADNSDTSTPKNKRKSKSSSRSGGSAGSGGGDGGGRGGSNSVGFYKKAKEISYVALESVFRRLLSCTTKVDVVG